MNSFCVLFPRSMSISLSVESETLTLYRLSFNGFIPHLLYDDRSLRETVEYRYQTGLFPFLFRNDF